MSPKIQSISRASVKNAFFVDLAFGWYFIINHNVGVSRDFKRKPNLNWPKILRCSGFRASFVNPELTGDTAVLQGGFFNWSLPNFSTNSGT